MVSYHLTYFWHWSSLASFKKMIVTKTLCVSAQTVSGKIIWITWSEGLKMFWEHKWLLDGVLWWSLILGFGFYSRDFFWMRTCFRAMPSPIKRHLCFMTESIKLSKIQILQWEKILKNDSLFKWLQMTLLTQFNWKLIHKWSSIYSGNRPVRICGFLLGSFFAYFSKRIYDIKWRFKKVGKSLENMSKRYETVKRGVSSR